MKATTKQYRRLLADLTRKVESFALALRRLGLYQEFASLRNYKIPAAQRFTVGKLEAEVLAAAEQNALSAALWIAKKGEGTVAPGRIVADTAQLVEEMINAAPQPKPYACRRGCSFCCYEAVSISSVEAQAIASHVTQLPESERTPLLAKLKSYAQRIQAVGEKRMFKERVPCPFLSTEDGTCTIYSIRPYACRGLTSYDVTPCKNRTDDYQVDHVRYAAYSGACMGSALHHLPDQNVALETIRRRQHESHFEYLPVGVLKELKSLAQEAA